MLPVLFIVFKYVLEVNMRVKIFIDFWNFQIAWNDYWKKNGKTEKIKIPWKNTLSKVITEKLGEEAIYNGSHVYASVDKRRETSRKLSNWLNSVMSSFPGYNVNVKERRAISSFDCPECHEKIKECPHCGEGIKRSIEKGVDATLSVDLIRYAINDVYDRAILVSHDSDYIPAVAFVQEKGKHVINLGFRDTGFHLRKDCWDHIFVEDIIDKLLEP